MTSVVRLLQPVPCATANSRHAFAVARAYLGNRAEVTHRGES